MASPACVIHCQLRPPASSVRSKELFPVRIPIPKPKPVEPESTNIVLQPRLCNLRSYGSDRSGGLIRTRKDAVDGSTVDDVSTFFATLSEYIESSKRSHDFEIISARWLWDCDDGNCDGELGVQEDGSGRDSGSRRGVFGSCSFCGHICVVLKCWKQSK